MQKTSTCLLSKILSSSSCIFPIFPRQTLRNIPLYYSYFLFTGLFVFYCLTFICSAVIISNILHPSKYFQVRKTETIRNNLNPSWKILYIPMTELCDNDLSLPLRITVFDEDRNSHDDLIGEAEVRFFTLYS